jgi:hypothetical protein
MRVIHSTQLNLVAPPPRNYFTQYLHLNSGSKFSPCSHIGSLSPYRFLQSWMKLNKRNHTKFKEPLHTSNTCIFHSLHSYTWHINKSITLSHKSVNKSPNTRCKVPTNQESNSLAPRNHAKKLKIIDFYDLPVIYWRKSLTEWAADPPLPEADFSTSLADQSA